MVYSVQDAGTHYWYSDDAQRERSVAVLEAMRTYRAAESAMRSRTQRSMGLGENDLLALRYLLTAKQDGRSIGPKELTTYLGISSASTTVLIDRLERAGQVRREHSPFDRRALILVPTASTDAEIQAALGDVPARMVEVANRLDPAQAKVVIDFLHNMRAAVDEIDAHVDSGDSASQSSAPEGSTAASSSPR
ncbi:MarR family winged helix-turn-helix transcriptional regulator [Cryobacterium sp. AP23]